MQPIFNVLYYTMLTNSVNILIFLFARILRAVEQFPKDLTSDWSKSISLVTLDIGLTDDSVRIFMGMIVEALMYLYLTLNCMYDAVHANDEARYLHTRVNNLACDFPSADRQLTQEHMHFDNLKTWQTQGVLDPRFKQNFVNEDVYRAFCLLKRYMHSKMETHAGRHKALLNIFGLPDFQPSIAKRLFGYNLTH
ncbi:unnamed protein product [Allacma fusca]|uniref:Uncharacterized protein n=1 Tax=Allacma fusca TaxID=39272 RepID=A0A8J2LEC2_9HEXA|nr:unnamed protein product [Allacma fusca]